MSPLQDHQQKIPPYLKGILWSIPEEAIHLEKHKPYVINQVLSLGTLAMWQWLFKTFSLKEIKNTFLHHPSKSYTAPRFFFVKNFLFNLKDRQLNLNRYVKNLPRDTRSS